MSKITLTPNASGTGTFTVASPNSNTNRTLTLPDAEGNLVVNTATGVDITGTLTSDGLGVSGLVTLDDYSGNSGRGRINIGNSGQQYIEGYDSGNAGSGSYLSFGQGASERMRLDNSGRLGIGTTAIYAKLAIGTGTGGGNIPANTSVLFGSDDNRNIQFLGQTTSGVEGTIGAWNGVYNFQSSKIVFNKPSGNLGEMQFFTNQGAGPVERMRITSGGKVLCGLTGIIAGSRPETLQTAGVSGSHAAFATFMNSTGGETQVTFHNPNGKVGQIDTNGSSTSYITSSDYRLKTDAQPMTGASARVQALNPVNFEWIADGTRVDGFLAHEAQAVVPEAVTGTKDAMRDEEYEVTPAVYEDVIIPAVLDDEGNELEAERTEQQLVTEAVMNTRSVPDYQGIDQSKLVPLLTAALQEALTEISDLKARVVALEAV